MSQQLGELADRFYDRLEAHKRASGHGDFEWYPYDSMSNVAHFLDIPGGGFLRLLDATRGEPALDVGCGDGDLSFFLESLGYKVTAIDHPGSNYNGMRGVRELKQILNSTVEIWEADLDRQFVMPAGSFGLALFLGTLYHLKNPFYVLESLAKRARYCVLNTRIANTLPDGRPLPEGAPLAYLLDGNELNGDGSNYWIFSLAGLQRLLRRTHWELLGHVSAGVDGGSDPSSLERDERVYCLLKSTYGAIEVEMLEGWHGAEDGGWRWTERRFFIRARCATAVAQIVMKIHVPGVVASLGPVTLTATVDDGQALPPAVFERAGDYTFVRTIVCNAGRASVIKFSVDRALPPDLLDSRERGIVVTALSVE